MARKVQMIEEKRNIIQISCIKNYQKTIDKIAVLIDAMNQEVFGYLRLKLEKCKKYVTFMCQKRDCRGNNQLFAADNRQDAIYDKYIAVIDIKPYVSNMEYFVTLMKKYMKFTMYKIKFKCYWMMFIKCSIFSKKRCVYEQKWEDS